MRTKRVVEILEEVIQRQQKQLDELHNRLMSRDYPEYVMYKDKEKEPDVEEPIEDDFDKIGSIT